MSRPRSQSFFQYLFGTKSTQAARNAKRAKLFQPLMETLERRDCRAGVTAALDPFTGILNVTGTDAGETITIQETVANRSLTSPGAKITVNGQAFGSWGVNKVVVHGLGGNDTIRNNSSKDSVLYGDGGADIIYGGWGSDTIYGGTNNDTLYGGDNNDVLYGEGGGDWLYGASGYDGYETGNTDDSLYGGDGDDHLYGGYGSDTLIGGNDNDWIQGQWGDDTIVGGNWDAMNRLPIAHEIATASTLSTNDQLFGENGNDTIYGGDGNDTLEGGWDSDTLYGDDGNDKLYGETKTSESGRPNSANNDWLWGGKGNDELRGGEGDDALDGGENDDALYGGDGKDNLVGGQGRDWLWGGAGDDTLWGASYQNVYTYQDATNYLFGEGDADSLYGGNGDDYLDGGIGNDGLFGGAGHNTLNGGADADRFLTWWASDVVQDATPNDATIRFENGGATFTDDDGTYDAQAWTDHDIERVDLALAVLHREAHGTTLLKTSSQEDMTFVRWGGTARGFNDGKVNMTDAPLQFGATDDTVLGGYLFHEIGHNWNGPSLGTDGNGVDRWEAFTAQSGWTNEDPNSDFYVEVAGGGWWHLKVAVFASNYGEGFINEDWAESFSAYFAQKAGWTFYNNDFGDGSTAGADAIPAKIALIDEWVQSL